MEQQATPEEQRTALEATMARIEAQRALLGDADTDTTLALLRRHRDALDAALPQPVTAFEAERKLVTIVFADIAGFTALSEAQDPEVVRGLMNTCFAHLAPVIQWYQGTVERFLGDAMVALFGAPVAHENDPERALRAALGLMEALADLNRREGTALQMHIGVNTGLVVAGGIGSPGRQQYSVMGDAINLASRLDDAADAGEILVGPETYRLTATLFDFEARPPMRVKGKAETVAPYRLLRARRVRGTERDGDRLYAPLVGREHELRQLRGAIERLQRGQGSHVALVGEAGLGKSRLIAEARLSLPAGLGWIEGHCLSYTEDLSYWIVRDMLTRLIGIDAGMSPPDAAATLAQVVEHALPEEFEATYPYLGRLLDLPLAPGVEQRLAALKADVLQRRVHQAVVAFVRAQARERPLVLVWEDLQWADPSSLALLDELLPVVHEAPLLILVVFRSGEGHASRFQHHLLNSEQRRPEVIALRALDDSDSARLLDNLLWIENLTADTRQLFLAKAEGNPFYLEEMLRVLVDDGSIVRQGDRAVTTRPITAIDVPNTLQGVIMARIDCLPVREKRILQTAAIIGRVFQHRVLAHLLRSEIPNGQLDASLVELQERDFIEIRAGTDGGGEREYIFKHALTRQTAYNSLLIARRRELHRRAGEVIEELFPDTLDDLAATLGFHFEQAGACEKSVRYLVQAGDAARAMYAGTEAVTFYRAAIKEVHALLSMRAVDPWSDMAIQLYENLGDVLALTGQNDAARRAYRDALVKAPPNDPIWRARLYRKAGKVWEALHGYDEALESYALAEKMLGDVPEDDSSAWWQEHIQILLERMFVHYWRAEVPELTLLAEQTWPEVERHGMPEQRAGFFLQLANANVRRDRYVVSDETLAYSRSAVAASEEADNLTNLAWARFVLAGSLYLYGDLDAAEDELQTALLLAERTGDVVHQARCLTYLTLVRRKRGQVDAAREMTARSLEVATAGQMLEYLAMARANMAWLAWRDGDDAMTQEHAWAALELWRQTPLVYPFQWTALLPLLSITLKAGRLSEALDYARALLAPTQQRFPDALDAPLTAALGARDRRDDETARAELQRAIAAAEMEGYL